MAHGGSAEAGLSDLKEKLGAQMTGAKPPHSQSSAPSEDTSSGANAGSSGWKEMPSESESEKKRSADLD
jgi:hypothetical protein